jgi:hypothetical protein
MGCDRRRAWAQKVILVLGHPKIINDSMGNVIKTLRFLGFHILHQMGPHTQDFLFRDAALSCSTQSLYIILLCSLVYSKKCTINGWGWAHQYLDLIHKHTGLHVHMCHGHGQEWDISMLGDGH